MTVADVYADLHAAVWAAFTSPGPWLVHDVRPDATPNTAAVWVEIAGMGPSPTGARFDAVAFRVVAVLGAQPDKPSHTRTLDAADRFAVMFRTVGALYPRTWDVDTVTVGGVDVPALVALVQLDHDPTC